MVLEAVEWVQKTHPKIWQRRGGRDHIYLIPNDEGAFGILPGICHRAQSGASHKAASCQHDLAKLQG